MVISFKGEKQTRPQTCRFAPRQTPCDIDFAPSILPACVKMAAILKRMNVCKPLNWENRSKWRVETMQWRGFLGGCAFWNCGMVLITSASFGSSETVMLLWFAITSQDISWLLPIIIEQSAFSDRSLQQPFIVLLNHTLNAQNNNSVIPGSYITHDTTSFQLPRCSNNEVSTYNHKVNWRKWSLTWLIWDLSSDNVTWRFGPICASCFSGSLGPGPSNPTD